MKGRKFSRNAMQHIYQRCVDHGVLFYTTEDRLVYYTLAACNARKHDVRVLASSIMFTHVHHAVTAGCEASLAAFLHDTNTSFSRLYNYRYNRKGILIEKHPGISQKRSSKDKRSIIIYVFNNHVEKGLCLKALHERWSLLAYAGSAHPFSEDIVRKKASASMKRALNLVDRRVCKGKGLEYSDLDRIFVLLSEKEREQFIDYVISSYSLIDYSLAVSFFGSIEQMILAIDSTTGGEYEIKEDYTKLKDTGYIRLLKLALTGDYLSRIHSMSDSERTEEAMDCAISVGAHLDHLCRFFHIEIKNGSAR